MADSPSPPRHLTPAQAPESTPGAELDPGALRPHHASGLVDFRKLLVVTVLLKCLLCLVLAACWF